MCYLKCALLESDAEILLVLHIENDTDCMGVHPYFLLYFHAAAVTWLEDSDRALGREGKRFNWLTVVV